jgi:hypothetical protein
MRRLALAITVFLVTTASVTAQSRFQRSLLRLTPTERLVQICDYAAMQRIHKDHRQYRPDRAVADAMTQTYIDKNTITAKGAAFRSHGKWYAISYTCTATSDNMQVRSFKYKIGGEIPESKWTSYGLWQ